MTAAPTTGHKGMDALIRRAVARGLNVEIDRSRGDFVTVRITNEGKAGENGLNDVWLSLYVSFSRSKRGAWWGGHFIQMLGKSEEVDRKAGKGVWLAEHMIDRMFLTEDHRPEWEQR